MESILFLYKEFLNEKELVHGLLSVNFLFISLFKKFFVLHKNIIIICCKDKEIIIAFIIYIKQMIIVLIYQQIK